MNFLSWVLFGLIVGIVANAIDPQPARGGILGAILLGIIGAVVGGFLANVFFGVGIAGFNLTSFMLAVVGSLLVILGVRAVRRI